MFVRTNKRAACLLSLFLVLITYSANTLAQNDPNTLSIGLVSNKAKENIAHFQPLMDLLAQKLGYQSGEVRICNSYAELASLAESGEIDLTSASTYSALILEQHHGINILAKRWKYGLGSYHSVFFSLRTSSINSLDDLVGKTIVFERNTSTSAYFLPMIDLLNQGYQVQHLSSPNIKPDANKIGYVFIQDHLQRTDEINMSLWVLKGLVDACAFSNDNWQTHQSMPVNIQARMNIFYRTNEIPRNFVSASPKLDSETAQKIQDILISLHLEPHGKPILDALQSTTKFETLSDSDQKVMDSARDQISNILALASNP
ncbi:phosphate/phosphite/phosphonate ABC transporter substrate-binding protein [Vibrio tapetis]|uniref:Putative alkylphosphonate ABC transporter n=1 Tax=Vibrio tapetis subsp. tapetis TaxID=1671868 RepID=A0A2N8Z9B8_9VIBR|nr:phosphate/phosphite/phosphonate ABC transporter substrate-binding protein [Vibrio tapetis]SON48509.1 putative alkylphosphonate ABC transporter [Vibrio tapetis subsp. tapetis]